MSNFLWHKRRKMPRINRGTKKKGGIVVDSAAWVRGRGREGADAQEAHLYAFPLITGRGQWLPLHNGFASASHLLPASLGEEEVEEEEEWRDRHQKLLVSKPNMAMWGHIYTQACTHVDVSQL